MKGVNGELNIELFKISLESNVFNFSSHVQNRNISNNEFGHDGWLAPVTGLFNNKLLKLWFLMYLNNKFWAFWTVNK